MNNIEIFLFLTIASSILLFLKFKFINGYLLKNKIELHKIIVDSLYYLLGGLGVIMLWLTITKYPNYLDLFVQVFIILLMPVILILLRVYFYEKYKLAYSKYDWGLWYIGLLIFPLFNGLLLFLIGYLVHIFLK